MPVLSRSVVVCIVTPGTREANNGNWRTAARWASMLRGHCRIILQSTWSGEPCDAMIALHARRSAASVAAFREKHPDRGLAVMLTGTDLYRDLPDDLDAIRSLDAATRIVTLQDEAPRALKAAWRRKCEVIYQSAVPLAPAAKPRDTLDVVVVGHLREEKDPATLFAAIGRLPPSLRLRVRHIGAALDPGLGRAAAALAQRDPRYRFVGALPHGLARTAIKRAHLLVHPSILEGGANVIAEALTSGTSVLASRMAGNLGMLGRGYPGYFPVRDASALAARLVQCCEEPAFLAVLRRASRARSALFRPGVEARAVRGLVSGLLA